MFAQEIASCSAGLPTPVELIYAPVREAEIHATAGADYRDFAGTHFRWVTFTSANGVLACEQVIGVPLSRFLAPFKVACVGKATAHALETRGVPVDFTPSVSDATHMVREFPEDAADHERPAVLCVQGTNARATLTEGLTANGWSVTAWNVYTMSSYPAQSPLNVSDTSGENKNLRVDQAASALDSVSAVVATAPSLLTELYDGWRSPQVQAQSDFPLVIAIGATTARAAEQLGLRVVQSPSPSPRDLAQTTIDSIEKEDNTP